MIGAGLSQGAGYPGWDELLEPFRAEADIPDGITDAAIVAEYVVHEITRARFEEDLVGTFAKKLACTRTHHHLGRLAELGVRSVWTTNYDRLLEDTFPQAFRIVRDDDYSRVTKVLRQGRLTKMHGSVKEDQNDIPTWDVAPVITRSDYETFQVNHPLVWAELQARFLTNTFLFLGFSFNDPNVEVLLRLSRTVAANIKRSPHFAVMKRETEPAKARLQDLRVRDLELSGIKVCYIKDFGEIDDILADLRRRLIPPTIFVSGSSQTDRLSQQDYSRIAQIMAERAPHVSMISMGSGPAYRLGLELLRWQRRRENYQPEKIRYYFRSDDRGVREVPAPPTRNGAAIYTDMERGELLRYLLSRTTAMISIFPRLRSWEEANFAEENGIPVFHVWRPLDLESFTDWLAAQFD